MNVKSFSPVCFLYLFPVLFSGTQTLVAVPEMMHQM